MNIYEEARLEYKGYECRVLFMNMGHRCGYIKIPKGHPLCVDDYNYINHFVTCHGGLTYAAHYLNGEKCDDGVWVGFDCHHSDDAVDLKALEKYYPEMFNKYHRGWMECYASKWSYDQTIKTLDFCKDQLKSLAEQLENAKEEYKDGLPQISEW